MRLLSVAGIAAGVSLIPATASAVSLDDPCSLAAPEYGPPTSQVRVHGCGFWAYETVKLFFGSTLVAREVTDDDGEFRTEFNVSPTTPSGATVLSAEGEDSGRIENGAFVVLSEDWRLKPLEPLIP